MSYKRISVSISADDVDWAKENYVSVSKVLQKALKDLRESIKNEPKNIEKPA